MSLTRSVGQPSFPEARAEGAAPSNAASEAQELAQALDERGLFVAVLLPVVPKGQERIRTQMSAALTEADVDFAIAAFALRIV